MRSLVRLTSIALLLAGLTGCHHWQKRRVAAVSYADCCDPCVSAAPIATPVMSSAGPPVVSKVLPYGTASPRLP
jgi:uncharacterized iron-regulated membrane protein